MNLVVLAALGLASVVEDHSLQVSVLLAAMLFVTWRSLHNVVTRKWRPCDSRSAGFLLLWTEASLRRSD